MNETRYGLQIELSISYETAVERATAALKAEGIGVLTTIDVRDTLRKKLDRDFRKYLILGACNPPLAERALQAELEVGLLLPCNVIGSMLTSGDELIDALFGHAGILSWPELAFGLAMSIAVVMFVVTQRRRLVVALVSPDIARTAGIDVRRLDLVFLQMFAMTVALGLRYLGVLLMGSLIIIPAATAKRLSHNLTQMLIIASIMAVLVTVVGSYIAARLHRETGSIIVTIAAGLFFLSLARRPAEP